MAINFSEEDKEKLKNDKSEIYTKRTEETYAEYVKNLKGRKKGKYFADYYLKFVITAVIIAVSIMYFINGKASKRDTALSVAIEGDAVSSGQLAGFAEIIEDELNIDTEHEMVDIFCVANDVQLQTLLYTGEADIVISPAENFQKWAKAGCFSAPEDKEELMFYNDFPEEQKYYSEYIDEDAEGQDGSKLYNYGIYLTGTDKYTKELGGYISGPVAGISSTSENIDNAVSFLRYMTRE